ncbi:unnamed protein product [Polarella glacialis]|uniref:Uncharacterized protein n=1 Tax=Polarella glacialis TaxID=89957 RepID=A0A813FVG6_POLGL|nr:unnamed protein product [Polarella glacialis]
MPVDDIRKFSSLRRERPATFRQQDRGGSRCTEVSCGKPAGQQPSTPRSTTCTSVSGGGPHPSCRRPRGGLARHCRTFVRKNNSNNNNIKNRKSNNNNDNNSNSNSNNNNRT